MEAETDTLVMHLCEERAPEDQKFVLQEVSKLYCLSLPPSVGGRGEHGGQVCSPEQSWQVSGLPPCTGAWERHGEGPTVRARGPVSAALSLSVHCGLSPLRLPICLHLELQRLEWEEALSQG